MEPKKFRIPVHSGLYLVAREDGDADLNAIYIYLEDENGKFRQNVACVSEVANGSGVVKEGEYSVSVYEDDFDYGVGIFDVDERSEEDVYEE